VQVFSKADGVFVRKWGIEGHGDGQLYLPNGVAVDSEHVYVSDRNNHRVQIFCKSDGVFVRKWGIFGQGDGGFQFPYRCRTRLHYGQWEQQSASI
jgi:hypothetical protein